MGKRRERQLGWVTVDGQRFPRERASDWGDAVEKGLCPFCGAGPFVVVAAHVNQRHGIDRHEFRDMLGLPVAASICDPTHSAAARERGKRNVVGRDMATIGGMHGGPRRKTRADRSARARPLPLCVLCSSPCPAYGRATCSDACRRERQSRVAKATRAADVRAVEMFQFICPVCGERAEKPAATVRANRKNGWDGPFCGMSCAGVYRQGKRATR